ncbi:hypothetical protein D1871_00275 [Nakamurella silvestris]|nr:hypothetical protein D1871_00275 [Nakamurella silvestris]
MKLKKFFARSVAGAVAGAMALGLLAAAPSAAAAGAVPAPAVAAPAVAAVAAAAEPTNVALVAVPSASYTPSWNNVNAVNNGSGVNSGGALSATWGTWDGTRPAQHWLQYTWDAPVTISRSVMMFWTDAVAGSGDNVNEPKSWSAQYWNAATQAWVDLPGASAYGTARTGTNETTFTPVTTTQLRATFNAYPNAAGTSYAAISVAEWEVWGTPATVDPGGPDPTGPISIDEVHVRTTPGVVPTLPSTIGVVVTDGVRKNLSVTWAAVTTTQVATTGTSVAVTGAVEGTTLPATATIWVRTSPSTTISALEDAAALTVVAVAPQLPGNVVAVYADGSKENKAVTWAAVPAGEYAAEGFFVVEGTVAGTSIKAQAWVIVDAATAGGDTEAPVVSLSTSPEANGTGWVTAAVSVTASAQDNVDTEPAVEIDIDGAGWAAYTAPVTVSAQGSHTVKARATDQAGNVSAVKDQTFKIDSIAPVTVPTVTDNGNTVTISFAGTDTGSGTARTQYSVGDGFWATYSGEFVVNKLATSQEVEYASTDVAGNEETRQHFTISALANQTAPSTTTLALSATTVPNSGTVKATVTVTSTGAVNGTSVTVRAGDLALGSGELQGGKAVITLSGLPVGVHQIVADFPGAAGVAASKSSATPLTVHFADYAPGSQFYNDVVWLAGAGITTGFDNGTFKAGSAVDRQSMAAFLYRTANPGVSPAACTVKPYSDVETGSQFCPEITWLKSKGITTGYTDGKFHGADKIQRQAMAAFLYRLANRGVPAAACTVKPFSDVGVKDPFCGEITWLVARGITNGFDDGTFRGLATTDRQTMAAFLHRYVTAD